MHHTAQTALAPLNGDEMLHQDGASAHPEEKKAKKNNTVERNLAVVSVSMSVLAAVATVLGLLAIIG
ncbi:MAG: hypothetical protein AAFX45_14375 [Pseudomonadota bacterium]